MKILIADPHPEVQSALHLILERIQKGILVSEAGSLIQLLTLCAQSCPDLILIDLDLARPSRAATQPLTDLFHVFQRLCPHARVIAMSSRFEAQQEALEAGASGFISKTDPPEVVLSAVLQIIKTSSFDPC
jgi:two-component system, NarL family, invasion response regulator UvrY